MMASRGMGAILPSKMPGAKRKARRDDTDFDQYAEGGKVKANPMNPENPENPRNPGMKAGGTSKVNQAGVYTKPGMRKSLFESIKSRAVQGTGAGQWSARKAQLLAKQYKARGGGYK